MKQYSLTIPEDILSNKELSLSEKAIAAAIRQYPSLSANELSSMLNITKRNFLKHKKNITSKTGGEQKFTDVKKFTTEQKFTDVKKFTPPQNAVQMDTLTHRTNVNKVLKFIKTLTSQEIYDEKRKRILEIYTHKEMFTDEDFALFDEKIDEMRSKFEEM